MTFGTSFFFKYTIIKTIFLKKIVFFSKGLFQWLISHFLVHFFCQKYTSKYNFTTIAHNSLNNGFWAVLIPFLEVRYIWCFWMENHVFDVRKKSSPVLCIFVHYFFTSIYHYNIGLNFPNFQTSIAHNFWFKSVWQV